MKINEIESDLKYDFRKINLLLLMYEILLFLDIKSNLCLKLKTRGV